MDSKYRRKVCGFPAICSFLWFSGGLGLGQGLGWVILEVAAMILW